MFARTIRACPSRTNQAHDRGHVYNGAATALLEHLPNLVLQAEPDAFEIDLDGPIPVFFGLSGDGYPNTLDPGVIEGDVQAAKSLHRRLNQRLNFGGLRHVGFYKQAFATGGAHHLHGFLAIPFAPSRNHYFGSCLCEKYGGLAANTRRPASHEPDFAFQFRCHSFPSRIRRLKTESRSVGFTRSCCQCSATLNETAASVKCVSLVSCSATR